MRFAQTRLGKGGEPRDTANGQARFGGEALEKHRVFMSSSLVPYPTE